MALAEADLTRNPRDRESSSAREHQSPCVSDRRGYRRLPVEPAQQRRVENLEALTPSRGCRDLLPEPADEAAQHVLGCDVDVRQLARRHAEQRA